MSYKLIYLARRAATVSREDWPRTWKSHAIFASKFPVLEAEIRWLRYCNRLDQPMLDGQPIDLPMLSTDHDGVAIAGSPTLEGISGAGFTPEDRELIDEDERRVFDMLTPNFTFFTQETLLKDGKLGEAALYHFIPRAEGLDREEFTARYRDQHGDAARSLVDAIPGLSRAALNHPVNDPLPLFPFDGISEFWFASAEDAVRAIANKAFDPLANDLGGIGDLNRSLAMLTTVYHRWPKD
ncbi:MAG: EthD domain-containing protein [Novosphingobium sp.]|nr:EthD domain-containing protein [Novosphingobium sp.]